jgi:hypothetical protein
MGSTAAYFLIQEVFASCVLSRAWHSFIGPVCVSTLHQSPSLTHISSRNSHIFCVMSLFLPSVRSLAGTWLFLQTSYTKTCKLILSSLNPCLFIGKKVIAVVYVDNVLIYAKCDDDITAVIQQL